MRASLKSFLILPTLLISSSSLSMAQGVVAQKTLTTEGALSIAHSALEKCHADGYHISLTILDSSGLIKVQLRADGIGPHTLEHSRRKAYTALTFKRTSAETAKAWAASPTPPPLIEGTVGAAGGVPIRADNDVIGAIGVSGAPGGEKDEACASAGIAKLLESAK
jgi:uncharacterized protein GlcG (DUF336 family)